MLVAAVVEDGIVDLLDLVEMVVVELVVILQVQDKLLVEQTPVAEVVVEEKIQLVLQ